MKLQNISKTLFITGFSLLFFCLDRISKLWAQISLFDGDIALWGDEIRLQLEYNANLALSLPVPLWAQVGISFVVLIALIVYIIRGNHTGTEIEKFAFAMIFGGALGNLYDRVTFHQVVDFIAVWKFPVFNVADTLIFCGVFILLGREILKSK